MSATAPAAAASGRAIKVRPGALERRKARRFFADRLARRFVTFSGVAIILAIAAILFVLVSVVYPLFLPPRAKTLASYPMKDSSGVLAVVTDEYRENAILATPAGLLHRELLQKDARPALLGLEALGSATIVFAHPYKEGLALGLSDGRVLPVQVTFESVFESGKRRTHPVIVAGEAIRVHEGETPVTLFKYVARDDGAKVIARSGPKQLQAVLINVSTSLMGDSTREETRNTIEVRSAGDVTTLAVDSRGDDLFAGTTAGEIIRFDFREGEGGLQQETVRVQEGGSVTVLGFLNGDRTLISGDAKGSVSSWQVLQPEGGKRRMVRIHTFLPHASAVTSFSPSRRDKGFLTSDASGNVSLHYATTGKTLVTKKGGDSPISSVFLAPKADGFLAASKDGTLVHWSLSNPHPEITLRALFGKIWYEGYNEPEYVWQSTGGTDDFEAKFSLTPLIYGTLKGTFYALLVAIPLALFGALYTSQFMHPNLKAVIKPAVEIMAALPSVVLGFIAGLWLAPALERIVPAVLVMVAVIPAITMLASVAWAKVPSKVRLKVPAGYEVFLLVPVVILGIYLSLVLGGLLESHFLRGDYRQFLLQVMGVTYDQRNSIVVGLAMGFAVIPIIFTVAEDSLSSVPQSLTAGSLALGATRWQTALRTVLPTASPGIFSAIMIGFGRAVGETMIVLMATGNTPVMNWSMFSGFRAMSANIAVEMPEAPEGGTLFRVLFLAALLLFAMTFAVNTAAELVRLRLRNKYRTYE